MFVTSDIPCGNGRVRWIAPGQFEVQLIAYSKGPRYCFFKVDAIKEDCVQEVVLVPDPLFAEKFEKIQFKIWVRRGDGGDWMPLAPEGVEQSPEKVRFSVQLRKGEPFYISTELPRPYTETLAWMEKMAEEASGWARLHLAGFSMEGRPIYVLRVTAPARQGRAIGEEGVPVLCLTAGEHASEFAGEEIVRGMLALVSGEGEDAQALREAFVFDFILNVNPDGNFYGWHQYNLKDWREHNYAEVVDRSFHHEFGDALESGGGAYSPETMALLGWMRRSRPSFYLSAHSWLGHDGNPGAFHAEPNILGPKEGEYVRALNRVAIEEARRIGLTFETYGSSRLCGGHLGSVLLERGICPAYTIEGHMDCGRAKLQELGRYLLKGWIKEPALELACSKADRWSLLYLL